MKIAYGTRHNNFNYINDDTEVGPHTFGYGIFMKIIGKFCKKHGYEDYGPRDDKRKVSCKRKGGETVITDHTNRDVPFYRDDSWIKGPNYDGISLIDLSMKSIKLD